MSLVKRIMAREMLMVALAASLPAAGVAVEYQGAPAKKPARHGNPHHNGQAVDKGDRTPTTTAPVVPGSGRLGTQQDTVSSTLPGSGR